MIRYCVSSNMFYADIDSISNCFMLMRIILVSIKRGSLSHLYTVDQNAKRVCPESEAIPNTPSQSHRRSISNRPLGGLVRSGGEVLHAGCEQRLILLAGHIHERAVAVTLGVAHLAEHTAVRAGDAFDGQQ